ncbi:hypothetical protein [Methanococcus aeolicus]|uniref:hypothetical protein n=1 Tax=Methanococcus aeolicus TaxID=42879 RepID=UPI000ADF3456|nr:hypothetical protein [Methanococcus aeolicus]UXM84065.1 hypothetical protein N6C89_04680 [Methanococcus aeolicus]
MKKSFLLLIIATLVISNAHAIVGDVFEDYNSSFDTSTSIYLGYNYTPDMNSTELDE